MIFTGVRIVNYLFNDIKGNKWDKANSPDVFFIIKSSLQTLVRSEVVYNIPYTKFNSRANDIIPAAWRFTVPLAFNNFMQDTTKMIPVTS